MSIFCGRPICGRCAGVGNDGLMGTQQFAALPAITALPRPTVMPQFCHPCQLQTPVPERHSSREYIIEGEEAAAGGRLQCKKGRKEGSFCLFFITRLSVWKQEHGNCCSFSRLQLPTDNLDSNNFDFPIFHTNFVAMRLRSPTEV